jgi:hypothetical protein
VTLEVQHGCGATVTITRVDSTEGEACPTTTNVACCANPERGFVTLCISEREQPYTNLELSGRLWIDHDATSVRVYVIDATAASDIPDIPYTLGSVTLGAESVFHGLELEAPHVHERNFAKPFRAAAAELEMVAHAVLACSQDDPREWSTHFIPPGYEPGLLERLVRKRIGDTSAWAMRVLQKTPYGGVLPTDVMHIIARFYQDRVMETLMNGE